MEYMTNARKYFSGISFAGWQMYHESFGEAKELESTWQEKVKQK
jgi:hypothetical protein